MGQSVPPHWSGYNDIFYEPLYIIGRLKPGVNMAQASTDVNLVYQQIFHQLLGSFPDKTKTQKNRADLERTHVPRAPANWPCARRSVPAVCASSASF
jgi:hypothetical protein